MRERINKNLKLMSKKATGISYIVVRSLHISEISCLTSMHKMAK